MEGQNDSSFPRPPWETQPDESNTQVVEQYPEMYIHPQVQQTVSYGQQNAVYPQGEYMGNNVYLEPANQPFQNNQYAWTQQPQQQTGRIQPGQMYPQHTHGYQMQGYGYLNSYGQQDPQLLQRQMTSSAQSYSSASKPKNSEDKLFGDLVDISKFKSAKSNAG